MQWKLYHRQTGRYATPLPRNGLALLLRVNPGLPVTPLVWFRRERWLPQGMELAAESARARYYRAVLQLPEPRAAYYFQVVTPDGTCWLTAAGQEREIAGEPRPFQLAWAEGEVFRTPAWVPQAVFYQIFPDRFANGDPQNDPPGCHSWADPGPHRGYYGGDLRGIRQRIPYLRELGVTAVWLNPIFAASSYHRYDTTDYYRIDPLLGDEEEFRKLLDELHAAGIRLILDGVFNHTSDRFWAFLDAEEKGPASRYWNWYKVHDFPICRQPQPNYACWWGFPGLPQLNAENPEVREYLLAVAAHWTALGIDGWRLDVPNEVEHSFWREFRRVVKSVNPEAYIVGEIWHNGLPWLTGDQFDGVMNYVFRDLVLDFFARGRLTPRAFLRHLSLLRVRYPYQAGACLLNLLGSHDTARVLTVFQQECPPPGGRSRRAYALARLRAALLFQFTFPGAPHIYYGDEVGLTGGPDPDCRKPMPWREEAQDRSLLAYYRRLIALRRENAALTGNHWQPLPTDGPWLATMAHDDRQSLVLVINAGDQPAPAALTLAGAGEPGTVYRDLLSGASYTVNGGQLTLPLLQPWQGALLAGPPPVL